MKITELQYIFWNMLEHGSETSCHAEEGDLVAVAGNVVFLLQRKDDCNNIVCTLLDRNTHSLDSIRSMYEFCLWLWEDKGIRYVRVEGSHRRYRFLEKLFPPEEVVRDIGVTERNVFYCDLQKAAPRIRRLLCEGTEDNE